MTPTPDARLIEAMARRVYLEDSPSTAPPWSMLDNEDRERNHRMVRAALTAARAHGYALVPVGLLEEAADYLESPPDTYSANPDLAARLRSEAAKGGGA
jgi:hypothetical protein